MTFGCCLWVFWSLCFFLHANSEKFEFSGLKCANSYKWKTCFRRVLNFCISFRNGWMELTLSYLKKKHLSTIEMKFSFLEWETHSQSIFTTKDYKAFRAYFGEGVAKLLEIGVRFYKWRHCQSPWICPGQAKLQKSRSFYDLTFWNLPESLTVLSWTPISKEITLFFLVAKSKFNWFFSGPLCSTELFQKVESDVFII